MHFVILKMIAVSGFLAAFECTKFVFGRGSAIAGLREDPRAEFRWWEAWGPAD